MKLWLQGMLFGIGISVLGIGIILLCSPKWLEEKICINESNQDTYSADQTNIEDKNLNSDDLTVSHGTVSLGGSCTSDLDCKITSDTYEDGTRIPRYCDSSLNVCVECVVDSDCRTQEHRHCAENYECQYRPDLD